MPYDPMPFIHKKNCLIMSKRGRWERNNDIFVMIAYGEISMILCKKIVKLLTVYNTYYIAIRCIIYYIYLKRKPFQVAFFDDLSAFQRNDVSDCFWRLRVLFSKKWKKNLFPT